MRGSLSLRVRLALAMGALVGLVTVWTTVSGRSISLEVLEEVRQANESADRGLRFETALATAVATTAEADPWEALKRELSTLPTELGALAIDLEGELRAAWPPHWTSGKASWDGYELEFRLSRGGQESSLLLAGGTRMHDEAGPIGTLFVFEAPRPPATPGTSRWVGLALTAMTLGMVAAWFLASGLTAPLRDLTRASRRLARGERQVRVVAHGRDEVGQLSLAFNELVESLEHLEAARRRLVSDTAHELRTPLTRMRCQLEAAEDGLAVPDAAWFQALRTDVADLQKLVEDLQDLALAESGQLELERATYPIADLVQPLATTPGRRERLTVEGPASAHVWVDATRFRQMVGNLLENAFRWSDPDSSIRLEWGSRDEGWEIRVIDQGPGLPPEEQARVFERFYRSEPSRARHSGGSGLGLAIVRRLAEAHGGTVGVHSEADRGCRFWIRLPPATP